MVSPRRRLLLLGVACVAVIALLIVLGVRLLGGSGDTGARPDQARPGTVVLVPGYGGGRAALNRLAGRLEAQGRTTVVLTLPGDGTGDLLAQADTLDSAVRDALRHGASSVDVIGYSAGGVVTGHGRDRVRA